MIKLIGIFIAILIHVRHHAFLRRASIYHIRWEEGRILHKFSFFLRSVYNIFY